MTKQANANLAVFLLQACNGNSPYKMWSDLRSKPDLIPSFVQISPQPTLNWLTFAFNGKDLIAVGEGGTIVRSEVRGAKWPAVPNSTKSWLSHNFIRMAKLVPQLLKIGTGASAISEMTG